MRTLIVSLILGIFIVPCAVAIYLMPTLVAKFVPNLYLVCVCLASALATWAIIWVSLWIPNSTRKRSALSSTNRLRATSIPERKHEKYFEAMNQLQALAMNEGKHWKNKLCSAQGGVQLENLPLAPWATRRRQQLLELLDRLIRPSKS